MTPREELQLLRDQARLQALEARAAAPVGGSPPQPPQSAPVAPETFQRAGGYGAGSAGVNEAVIKAGLGLKQLIGLGTAEDQAVLREIAAESEADPQKSLRTTGNIVGNVALTAIPGTQVAKGIQAAKFLPKVLAPLAAAGGSAAATEFALAPGEGGTYGQQLFSKAKEAAKAGALGAGITGAIGAAAKPLTGLFKPTVEAVKLYAQGINPTLQQAAAGLPGRFIGGLTAGVQNIRQRLNDEGANAILRKSTEGKIALEEGTGEEFAKAARSYVGDEYDKLWAGKKVQLSPRHREAIVSKAGTVPADMVGADEAAEAARIVANRMGVVDGQSAARTNYPLNPETFRERFRNPLTKDAMGAEGAVKDRLLEARALLDKLVTTKNLTPAEKARLKEINSLNFDAIRLEEATGRGMEAHEGVDFNRLAAAYSRMLAQGRSMGNTTFDDIVAPMVRTLYNTPNQNTARSMKAAAMKFVPIAGAGLAATGTLPGAAAAAAPLYALSLIGQTAGGARKLLGQEKWQKKLAEEIRKYGASTGATLGTSLTDQE